MKSAATILIAALMLAACGKGGPDLAACESAMRAQYQSALADPSSTPSARPDACKGVSDADLQTIAARVMETATP